METKEIIVDHDFIKNHPLFNKRSIICSPRCESNPYFHLEKNCPMIIGLIKSNHSISLQISDSRSPTNTKLLYEAVFLNLFVPRFLITLLLNQEALIVVSENDETISVVTLDSYGNPELRCDLPRHREESVRLLYAKVDIIKTM